MWCHTVRSGTGRFAFSARKQVNHECTTSALYTYILIVLKTNQSSRLTQSRWRNLAIKKETKDIFGLGTSHVSGGKSWSIVPDDPALNGPRRHRLTLLLPCGMSGNGCCCCPYNGAVFISNVLAIFCSWKIIINLQKPPAMVVQELSGRYDATRLLYASSAVPILELLKRWDSGWQLQPGQRY